MTLPFLGLMNAQFHEDPDYEKAAQAARDLERNPSAPKQIGVLSVSNLQTNAPSPRTRSFVSLEQHNACRHSSNSELDAEMG
jgi:hypothetical protein